MTIDALLVGLMLAQAPAPAPMPCAPAAVMMGAVAEAGAVPVFRGLLPSGNLLTLLVNPANGTWAVFATLPDAAKTTCLTGNGTGGEAIAPPLAGDPS
jgi:hypothetical protein